MIEVIRLLFYSALKIEFWLDPTNPARDNRLIEVFGCLYCDACLGLRELSWNMSVDRDSLSTMIQQM